MESLIIYVGASSYPSAAKATTSPVPKCYIHMALNPSGDGDSTLGGEIVPFIQSKPAPVQPEDVSCYLGEESDLTIVRIFLSRNSSADTCLP